MLRTLLLVCACASAGLFTQPADARPRERNNQEEQQEPRRDTRDAREAPRPRRDGSAAAARRAQERNGGGRVLSVDPEGDGYRVKVLKDGEVRTHHVVAE